MKDTSSARFRPRLREVLLAIACCFLFTMVLRYRTDLLSPGTSLWNGPYDHWKYEYVAQHPLGSFHIQPVCWRIGDPLLTRILPFSTFLDFEILTIGFLTLAGALVYFWLRVMPRTRDEALLGVLLFYSLGPAVKVLIENVETPDPASYFFILLALYAIYAELDLACAIALALGMFVKETLLVTIPLHYSLKAKRLFDWQRLKRTMLVAVPAICVFVGIRLLIPAWNDRDDYVHSLPFKYTQVSAGLVRYDLRTAFEGTIHTYRTFPPVDLVRMFTWGSLGILLFLPFLNIRENKNVLLRWLPYALPTVLTLFIALNPDRRLGSLFPMLIVMGLNGLRVLGERLGATTRDFQIIFLAEFALLLLKKDVNVPPFDFDAAVFIAGLCWLTVRGQKLALESATTRTRLHRA